jgi:outer membrane protein assembly complex protein YaeT
MTRLPAVFALQVDDLDPDQEWRLKELSIDGNTQFSTGELQAQIVTKPRPWYVPWRQRPSFDPVTFTTDIERLASFYRAQGYYHATVSYDLTVDETEHLVNADITITEGEPVLVSTIDLAVTDDQTLASAVKELRSTLPLVEGMVFTEERYQQTETRLKTFLLEHHRGRAVVSRHATVMADEHRARVTYTMVAGPYTVFGETTIEGTEKVDPALIRRELTYQPGDPFTATAIEESQRNVTALDLFQSVRFAPEEHGPDPATIPMRVRVDEKRFREWQIGLGFDTEEEVRGQVRWRHNNWLGGGRRLDAQLKLSFLQRHIEVTFLQPHVFDRYSRFTLTFRPQQLDEPGYLLNATRLQPRLERNFSKTLTGFVAYRLEYDRLSDVSKSSRQLLREFQRKGVLSGLSIGLLHNTTDNALNATRGTVFSFSAEQLGGVLGGDFDFTKFQGEAKGYHLLAPRTVLAGRLKLGFAEPVADGKEVPMFERFFAGGVTSVRGYGRHRLGPISDSDDPVGGRSVIEGALELRQNLTEKLGAILFVDFGQVSLESFDVPLDNLEFAAGFGAFYSTPVGPVSLNLGFPFDPPSGDQSWQIHFNIGQYF